MVIINCIGGLGDIMFCEPIFRFFLNRDKKKPIVLIHAHQMWIQNYIDSADFSCKPYKSFITGSLIHNDVFINLRYANQILRGYGAEDHHDYENMMLDKYRLLGLKEDLWKSLNINFDVIKASALAEQLKVGLFDDYIHVNENWVSGSISINLTTKKEIVKMKHVSDYTMIDWYLIIAQAGEIHHVSTSTFFLMQALMNRINPWLPPDIFIYPRPNEDGLRGVSHLQPDFNLTRVEKC